MSKPILGLLLWVVPCMAETIVVKDDGSGDYPTIQDAINAATAGDTVELQPGTYRGVGNRDIDFEGKAITIRSTDPADPAIVSATIIDCEGTASNLHRGFFFFRNEDAGSILAGLTITNGYADRGGAIYCHNASPTITSCNILGNTANNLDDSDGGGGIYCWSSSSLITNCTLRKNIAKDDADGGAIRSSYTSLKPTISNCVISGNTGDRGGGLFNCDGPISNCIITGNSAYSGAGLHSCDGPITECTISLNSGDWTGGLDWCNGLISKCTITSNSSKTWGGAGMGWCNGTVSNCIIAGNHAAQWGGGIYGSAGTFRNCVIFGNKAGVSGGGICLQDYEQMTMINCIIWNNVAPQGSQIALMRYSPEVSLSYCDVEGGTAGIYDHNGFSLKWSIGNIDEDPHFVSPGYWNMNNTPDDHDDDVWVDGDYHLKSEGWRWNRDANQWTWDRVTSRCIDAGNSGTPLGQEPITLNVDPLNRWGQNSRVDMGAYGGTAEASMPIYEWALTADLTNDGTVNLEDHAVQASDWQETANLQPGDLDRDGIVNISDVVVLAEDWLKRTIWER